MHAATGNAVIVESDAAQLSGLLVSGAADGAPVIDVRRGDTALEDCRIQGDAWAAVLAWADGALAMRGCEVSNAKGAGIVAMSRAGSTGNLVEKTRIAGVGSSRPDGPAKDGDHWMSGHPSSGPLTELDALVGLTGVKQEVRSLINLVTLSQRRQAAGLPMPPLRWDPVDDGPQPGSADLAYPADFEDLAGIS